jgi:nucleoside-diphosphate-sugar epimerase
MGFWTGKKVLVTGGAGFVGSHLVELLLAAEARVTVIDDFSRGSTRVQGASYFRVDVGSVRADVFYQDVFAVFNLAAHVAGVIYNQGNHLEMHDRNMRLLTAPLLAAAQAGVQRFLQISSVCVYSPENLTPCEESKGTEGQPTPANEGYSWAKRMGERAALWSRIPHVGIVRPSNIYGPRDYFGERAHVVPALIRKATLDGEIIVNGTGNEYREFLYVEDAARGMMHVLEHGVHGEAYNLGTHGDTCVPTRILTKMIQQATGTERKPVSFLAEYDSGDAKRYSDCSKIHALGWKHQVGLEEGLARTLEWYTTMPVPMGAHS